MYTIMATINKTISKSPVQQELKSFRKNMDSWVKYFNGKLQVISNVSGQFNEVNTNTNHNYELIKELKEDMEEMKAEIKTMKLMQMMILEKTVQEEELV